jgi:mannonate dehydratase
MSEPDATTHLGQRRRLLCCIGAAAAGLASGLFTAPTAAAPWAHACRSGLPGGADELLAATFDGLDPAQLWDMHAHLLGTGDSGSGASVHPSLNRGFNPVERFRMRAILDAACVTGDAASVDAAYVDRLLALTAAFPPGARWLLFAFERAYGDEGRPSPHQTTVHVPDNWAATIAARHPQRFGWVASIHPYRPDAIEALDQARRLGALAVKWLPSSMNIDLRDARSRRFAEALAAARMPLVVHCGEERAVPGARRDDLVNPLHVRAPLERGATVIVAHCATLGHAADLDRNSAPEVPAFTLFERLMGESAWQGRLFGDLSAVFQINREPAVWRTLIERSQGPWQNRLLHGSDYPLPGLRWLTSLSKLQRVGLLDERLVAPLDTLRDHNPLLFDLALKLSLRLGSATLPASAFATRAVFDPPRI